MKPVYIALTGLLLSPITGHAQLFDNAKPIHTASAEPAPVAEPAEPVSSLSTAIDDPHSDAEDLGLASPGTGISLPTPSN
jgi:hypothetical protein